MSSLMVRGTNSSKTYSNRSFKTSEDSVCCSACKVGREQLLGQISVLKDKAHQSFMQVIQIQQLHEEELEQLREEYQEKENALIEETTRLERQLGQIKGEMAQLQRNVKRHSYDFNPKELVIDNIETITCEQGENSYLDQSELLQFRDLISLKNGNDYVVSLRKQIYKDIKFVSNNKTQIEKLFILIKDLKDQNILLATRNQKLGLKAQQMENQYKQLKVNHEVLSKDSKFMTEHLKRVSNDKLKLEKRIGQLERTRMGEDSNNQVGLAGGRQEKAPMTVNREEEGQCERTINMLQISKMGCSQLSVSKQINELSYAKFIVGQPIEIDFKKKKWQLSTIRNSAR